MPTRIGLVSLPIDSVPAKGTQAHNTLIGQLADGLVDKGHEVILYATEDSTSKAEIRSLYPTGLRYMFGMSAAAVVRKLMRRFLHEYNFWAVQDAISAHVDLIHVHDTSAIDWHRWIRPKMVCTVHFAQGAPADAQISKFWLKHANYYPGVKLVFISKAQRAFYPAQLDADIVYNGIDFSKFSIGDVPRDYLATLSRIHRGKGIHIALEVAKKLAIPLKIAGPVDELAEGDPQYFRDALAPSIDGHFISYVGELDDIEKVRFLQGAKALLHPIQMHESFGLTIIESIACGAPVISLDKGASRELIRHGENGYVVGSVEEMVNAVAMATKLESMTIRNTVVDQFSIDNMVDGYIRSYESVLGHT